MMVDIEIIVVSEFQLWKKNRNRNDIIRFSYIVGCGIFQVGCSWLNIFGSVLLCFMLQIMWVVVVVQVMLVLLGLMKVFVQSRIVSQLRLISIVSLVNGELKLMFFQLVWVSRFGGMVLRQVICSSMYIMVVRVMVLMIVNGMLCFGLCVLLARFIGFWKLLKLNMMLVVVIVVRIVVKLFVWLLLVVFIERFLLWKLLVISVMLVVVGMISLMMVIRLLECVNSFMFQKLSRKYIIISIVVMFKFRWFSLLCLLGVVWYRFCVYCYFQLVMYCIEVLVFIGIIEMIVIQFVYVVMKFISELCEQWLQCIMLLDLGNIVFSLVQVSVIDRMIIVFSIQVQIVFGLVSLVVFYVLNSQFELMIEFRLVNIRVKGLILCWSEFWFVIEEFLSGLIVVV